MAAPTPVPAIVQAEGLAQLYRNGDIMLQNPVESCIIFVLVIFISSFFEFFLDKFLASTSRYQRILVESLMQEITILGCLSLLLLFVVSVVPAEQTTDRLLFIMAWSQMNVFYVALFYGFTIGIQMLIIRKVRTYWHKFEEGEMDNNVDEMHIHKKRYKWAFDQYTAAMADRKLPFDASDVPFWQYLEAVQQVGVASMANLSWKTWLGLGFWVAVNSGRALGLKFIDAGLTLNVVSFVCVVGLGNCFILIVLCIHLQRMLENFVTSTLPPKQLKPVNFLPFGRDNSSLEISQISVICSAWYTAVWITGLTNEVFNQTTGGGRFGLYLLGLSPIGLLLLLLPLVSTQVAAISSLGAGLKVEVLVHLAIDNGAEFDPSHILTQEAEENEDDKKETNNEGDPAVHGAKDREAEVSAFADAHAMDKTKELLQPAQQLHETPHLSSIQRSRRGSKRLSFVQISKEEEQEMVDAKAANVAPTWLEDDDEWDGHRTVARGEVTTPTHAGDDTLSLRLRSLYLRNIDPETLQRAVGVVEGRKISLAEDSQRRSRMEGGLTDRPMWLEEDEVWDPSAVVDDSAQEGGQHEVAPKKEPEADPESVPPGDPVVPQAEDETPAAPVNTQRDSTNSDNNGVNDDNNNNNNPDRKGDSAA